MALRLHNLCKNFHSEGASLSLQQFSTKNRKLLIHFGYSVTQQWHFESQKKPQSWKWHEFVQTVASCTCILRVQSIGMCAGALCFFRKWHCQQLAWYAIYSVFSSFSRSICTGKTFQKQRKNKSIFSTLLSCKCSLSATNKTLWVAFKSFNMANPIISFCNQPIRFELEQESPFQFFKDQFLNVYIQSLFASHLTQVLQILLSVVNQFGRVYL